MPVLLFYYLFPISIPKNFFRLFHVGNGVNGEGAAFGAGAAGNAVAGVGFKRRIVLAYGFRHFALRFGKIQNLVTFATSMPLGHGAQWPQYMQCPSQLILGKLAKTSA